MNIIKQICENIVKCFVVNQVVWNPKTFMYNLIEKSYFKGTFGRFGITFFFLDFFFFSGVVFVVLSIEAIDGVLIEGTKSPELA